jgi:CDP-glucose 4,6-dehydratase
MLAEKMAKKRIQGEAFNLSCERPISVLGLVKIIYRMCGKRPKYKILNKAKHEIKKQYLSAKKAKTVIGWKAKCPTTEGLAKTIGWYRKLYNAS